MIKTYFAERRSWIILFICLQALTVFVAYLDAEIPLRAILYLVFLQIVIFIIFLAVRGNKETKFYQGLLEWENHLDLRALPEGESPFEKIIEKSIIGQTERLKLEASQNQTALEQEKDELLSWVHEVKTPLTALHLLIDRVKDEQVKVQLTHEWLRIHLLLDIQLHQKRIPSIENDLYIEQVKLKPLLFNEIKLLQSWCIQKGIGFDVELDAPEVLSDAKWLAFIIRQLLTNAVKYSDKNDIMIKSRLEDDTIKLEIQDFGRGIDPRDQPRIFDKGFTSTVQHEDHAATGMGLFLAKKAAKPLLIKIGVQSKPGTGTTFTLIFPKRNEFVRITGM
jgi:two-component system, OmpR family, bacitracin resistance sensor histidine kinase BceS